MFEIDTKKYIEEVKRLKIQLVLIISVIICIICIGRSVTSKSPERSQSSSTDAELEQDIEIAARLYQSQHPTFTDFRITMCIRAKQEHPNQSNASIIDSIANYKYPKYDK
jgi:hypothetical protein